MNRQRPARTTNFSSILVVMFSTFLAGPAQAQVPGESPPIKTTKMADLTNRYRFTETYVLEDNSQAPGSISSYRVGITEVIRDTIDTHQGAPQRKEASRQSFFVERPAELNGIGGASAVVRSFDRYRAQPNDPSRMMGSKPMEGLSVLVRPRIGDLPSVLNLIDGRRMTDYEFEIASRMVFVPHLAAILPNPAVRLGDTWRIPRRAAQSMLGDVGIQGDTLLGKFVELNKEVDGPRLIARISITGKAAGASGDVSVNAEALFTFRIDPPASKPPGGLSPLGRPLEDVIEARGAVTELRLGRLSTAELPGAARLKIRLNRELIFYREIGLAPNTTGPRRPEPLPAATEANAWLAYFEPSGHFVIQHPQDFLPRELGPVAPLDPNAATLVRNRREGRDMLQVEYVPKTLGIETLKQKLAAKYAVSKEEVTAGSEEWLPEAEWPLRMKVHRIEAVVKVGEPRTSSKVAPSLTPIHLDGYLIQFSQSASMIAIATTSRSSVAPFRREVEQILKTIQLDAPVSR